jgi:hypothetical protein
VRCLIPSARNCSASNHYAFGLLAARITRSGYEQPGALVFGQLFGPPFGGWLEPLWAPPATRDSSCSSSVRRVSLARVSFFMECLPLWACVVTVARFASRDPVVLPAGGTLQLPPVRAEMGIVKWLLREIILCAREEPAAAAARFFAEYRPMCVGPVIGA